MVRRRTRPTKTIASSGEQAAVSVTLMSQGMEGAVAVAISNGSVLEDQYFASPKRKDCKIDSGGGVVNVSDPLLTAEEEIDLISDTMKTRKSPSPIKSRSERGGISGRTIGVPLATRSQTRTIENFFKAKTAAKSANINTETVEQKCTEKTQNEDVNYNNTNDDDLSVLSIYSHLSPTQILQTETFEHDSLSPPTLQRQPSLDAATNLQPDFIFDLSEDTTDSENTELSDEYSTASGGGASSNNALPINSISNFDTHRSPNRGGNESNSSRSSTTDNIFLQEPVLTLNVDKSPNQASSIKINRTLEIEPIFSSPPAITASVLNGRFNQIVSLQCSPIKQRISFDFEVQPPQPTMVVNANCYALSAEHDTSSCDSGVAFGTTVTSSSSDTFSPNPAVAAVNATRRRKPATPHRIVCPSPIKAAPRMVSPACGSTAAGKAFSPSGRKLAASKDQLSPRKSQRHQASTGSKTRRRLNQPKDHQAPYQQTTTMQNGFNHQNGHVADDDHHHQNHHHIKDEKADDQEFENLHEVDNIAAVSTDLCLATPKSVLNNFSAASQLHQQKINKSHKTKTKAPTSIKHQVPAQPKMKLYQPTHAQPLGATNGNREMTEFFPVRRSERKTKTAVKEEMMRNLEQAILEERAEGLKIAHFENKGRGIVSERRFQRGEFVIEYVGDLISMTEAAEREKQYALDENAGCYMYYFKHNNQQYCIDATIDTGKLGRLVNHSRNGNLVTKVVVVKQRPHLILIAKDDIEEGEELTYDYGDRSKESLLHHPWLAF